MSTSPTSPLDIAVTINDERTPPANKLRMLRALERLPAERLGRALQMAEDPAVREILEHALGLEAPVKGIPGKGTEPERLSRAEDFVITIRKAD